MKNPPIEKHYKINKDSKNIKLEIKGKVENGKLLRNVRQTYSERHATKLRNLRKEYIINKRKLL